MPEGHFSTILPDNMAKKFIAVFLVLGFFLGSLPLPSMAESMAEQIALDTLLADEVFTDTTAMNRDELQTFLTRGSLASYWTKDVHGTERSAADILWRAAQEFDLNTQVLLVLLQREQSLVEDSYPTQDQLDWAMGYAICDSCSKEEPALQKFRGFGPQVHYAAQRIRESYLTDLHLTGRTLSGVGPGIPVTIDGVTLIPKTKATAALYTYTPHLHGNENFVRIWRRWFVPDYPNGSLLQNKQSEAVWLIRNGVRRPITTRVAFSSRYNERNIVRVDSSVLDAYPIGDAIRYPNYSLLSAPDGTTSLLVDDTLRRISSPEDFRKLGFSWDDVMEVTPDELSAFDLGTPLSATVSAATGRLWQNNKTGGVYYVEDNKKSAIISREILALRFPNTKITPVSPDELSHLALAEPVRFADGTLIGVSGTPQISIVSDGRRRHIQDEKTFHFFHWRWDQVVWTDERSALLHPVGDDLSIPVVDDLSSVSATL